MNKDNQYINIKCPHCSKSFNVNKKDLKKDKKKDIKNDKVSLSILFD